MRLIVKDVERNRFAFGLACQRRRRMHRMNTPGYRPHWWMIAVATVTLVLLETWFRAEDVDVGWRAFAVFVVVFAAIRLDMYIFRRRAAQHDAAAGKRRSGDRGSAAKTLGRHSLVPEAYMRIYFAALIGVLCMILACQWEEVAAIVLLLTAAGPTLGWVLAGWRPVARRLKILAACLAVCLIAVTAALAGPDAWLPVLVVGAVVLAPGFVLAVSAEDSAERGADSKLV